MRQEASYNFSLHTGRQEALAAAVKKAQEEGFKGMIATEIMNTTELEAAGQFAVVCREVKDNG